MVGQSSFDFAGATAIVTGSTKGIGRGIAERLADAGANVVVNSRTPADVAEVAESLDAEATGEVVGIDADLGDPEAIERLVGETLDRFETVEVLVNNAAVWPGSHISGSMHTDSLEDWEFGLGVNARGAFYCSKLVAESMIESDVPGAIVNMSSRAGEIGGNGHGLYGVSKAAVNGLTWRLAYDLGAYDIRVNAISTTMIDSDQLRTQLREQHGDLTDAELEALLDDLGGDLPLGHVGDPERVGDAVCVLASDAAAYTTGHVFQVDGGARLG